jgi:hypothetical protein
MGLAIARKSSFNVSPSKSNVGRIVGPPSLKNMSAVSPGLMSKTKSCVPSLMSMKSMNYS